MKVGLEASDSNHINPGFCLIALRNNSDAKLHTPEIWIPAKPCLI